MSCRLLELYIKTCKELNFEATWDGLKEFKKNLKEISLFRR